MSLAVASKASHAVLVLMAALAVAVGSFGERRGTAAISSDPPVLVPWNTIGNITLGELKTRVERSYGSQGAGYNVLQRYGDTVQGYYRLHGSRVIVTFYGDRVGELELTTRYYRTKGGFGVGSTIPLGRCHTTATGHCEHRWRGFVFNAWNREFPCNCWVKVGLGAQSLPATTANFLKPWFFIYTSQGRVTRFYFALKFTD